MDIEYGKYIENGSAAPRQGYLSGDYRLFHLTDSGPRDFDPHYHDFCKILVLISGSVDYIVEGRTYEPEPGDLVLVNRGEIHCPHVKNGQPYERVILYLSPAFLQEYSLSDPLDQCFRTAQYRHSSVIRPGGEDRTALLSLLQTLEHALDRPGEFAGPLYARILLLEFLIFLNRAALDAQTAYVHTGAMDYRVSGLISYINGHLGEELSIGLLAGECCLSPYHMMRLFRQETGCTIGNYINQKRLAFARELILSGRENATSACYAAGFPITPPFCGRTSGSSAQRPASPDRSEARLKNRTNRGQAAEKRILFLRYPLFLLKYN